MGFVGRRNPVGGESVDLNPPTTVVHSQLLRLWSTDLAHDVISLAEKGKPLVQDRLVLVVQIVPFRYTVVGLETGRCERTRGVLACEDCDASPNKGLG